MDKYISDFIIEIYVRKIRISSKKKMMVSSGKENYVYCYVCYKDQDQDKYAVCYGPFRFANDALNCSTILSETKSIKNFNYIHCCPLLPQFLQRIKLGYRLKSWVKIEDTAKLIA